MKRLLLIAVSFLAAAAAAVVPAVIGLAGNPSFSHQLPVRVPSQARSGPAVFTDDTLGGGSARRAGHRDDRGHARRHAEAGDDRNRRAAEPRDDRGRRSPEPGDDRGRRGDERQLREDRAGHHDADRGRSEHHGHEDGGSGSDHHRRGDDGGA
jgi:hypothetical protein